VDQLGDEDGRRRGRRLIERRAHRIKPARFPADALREIPGSPTMQFKPFEPGIEVFGGCVETFLDAFKLFPSLALRRLVAHGIGTLKGKNDVEIDRQGWYPLDKWLAAYEDFATSVGPRAVFQMGQHVPKYAVFPPSVTDIHSAIASVDIAYHMNHRKQGKVMFDPATGKKLSGIGSYNYQPVPGEKKIVCVCENPYACEFDRGILSCMASRFEKNARVAHDDRAACRKTGANSCTYVISWQ